MVQLSGLALVVELQVGTRDDVGLGVRVTGTDEGGDADVGDVDARVGEGAVEVEGPVAEAAEMIDLQLSDPVMNDAMLSRYPDATALISACDRSTALGKELVEDAHAAGALSEAFTPDDLMAVLWMAGTASRDPAAPEGWRRVVDRGISAAWNT